jgi:hypothetical protein
VAYAASASIPVVLSSTAAVDNFVDNLAALRRCVSIGALPIRLLKN